MWGKESKMHSFKNLKILQIICCQNMETIGPPSMFLSLLQLESLDIRNCQKMQQVISQESEKQEIREEIITFPKLKILRIWTSFNLKCFYGGSYQMKFPCLETMELEILYGMKKFAGCGSSTSFFDKQSEFPCLEELQLELSKQVTKLWDLDVLMALKNPLHKLRKLSVKKIKLPSIVFHSLSRLVVEPVNDAKVVLFSSSENEGCVGAYSQFPKLEELVVVRCPGSIEQFVEVDDSRAMLKFCGQLSNLRLNFGLNMKVISLHLFKSLRDLTIYSMKWEYLFSANGSFELWQSLEELNIYECTNLEVIIRGGDRENVVDFPLLKILRMTNLTRMSKLCSIPDIPFHFESLELIYISRCNRLETICLGPFVAPSLRTLYVGYCHELESLFCGEPNQVVEFPSLEKMTINYCNAMKSCSTRPLKAPKLRKLTVSGCPKMEWFLLGNANCGAELELPSLEDVTIAKCPNMKSFSPAILRAPKLQLVTVDDKPYPIAELKK
ncbi:uncharacterized protein LOC141592759 [Silene latifolia]|uniref:uncharacterized protein LOC141592759 n=1 Tax=Silene latifolia TaxID=37657 RepID=UPI003D781037